MTNFVNYLADLTPKLSLLKRDGSAEPFYDLMSDSLIWTDERLTGLTVEEMGCFRAICRYRTSLIIDKPDQRFQALWEQLKQMCPNWIGLTPSRCLPSNTLVEKYNQLKKS